MSRTVRHWLPLNVVEREVVRAKLDETVARWSTNWFSKTQASVSGLEPRRSLPRASDDSAWLVYPSGIAIHCPTRSAMRLSDWALDIKLGLLNPTPTDREVLDGFSRALLDDLAQTIALSLGCDGADVDAIDDTSELFGGLGGAVVEIDDDNGGSLLWAAVPLQSVLPLCRSSLAQAAEPQGRLGTLVEGIGPLPLSFEATLGSAHLTLSELRNLAPGDVLVLDTLLGAPVELILSGGGKLVARGELTEIDHEVALVLQS